MRGLLLTGTVGVGKTAVAEAIGDLLRQRGVPHAVVDLDELRRAWPAATDDRFHTTVMLRNLSCVTASYLDAGFTTLVLAGVLETAEDRARHAAAIDVPLTVCRLVADLDVVRRRLRGRHVGDHDGLAWHLHRAGELAGIQDASAVEDLRVDVSSVSVPEAASRVLEGWDAAGSPAWRP